MSTFTLPNTQVTVKLCDDLTREQLLEFPAFKIWLHRLQTSLSVQHTNPSHTFHSSPYALRSLTIQSMDRFGSSRIGFIKLSASITNSASESLPGAVFLRGASVGMLVVLQPDDLPHGSEAEKYVLLTVQPRVAAGSLEMVELPAGMVDGGTAAKEIKEELGLDIPEGELLNMTELAIPGSEKGDERLPRAMYPSAGGCDECIPLFLHEKRVPRGTLSEWTGRLTGLRDQGEKITLKLVRREDLWWQGARDAKALGALALWEGLKRNGKL
ncbi:Nudix hydrolase 14-like protein [Lachnellula subtilissima]|uniref:Nudix hydrolase 14-like protein n=1 Tax=Lachnellula subtilissima TaxID=602034 RepID=A0A8H8RDZ1_9HELO|nr:Nudix hydrolase 14-like protein [Lachnellula subtilissima]